MTPEDALGGGDGPVHQSDLAAPTRQPDADALAHQLGRLARLFERVKTDTATRYRHEVERAAYALLAYLVMEGPQRLCALADAVQSDPSTVSRQVAQLVQLGLVQRRPDPEDGRAAQLSATEAGGRAFAEYRRIRTQRTAAVVSDWPTQDVHRLVELLDRLNTDFENYRAQLAAGGRPEQEGPPS